MVVIIKEGLIYKPSGETMGCFSADRIACANFHPGTNVPMYCAEQLVGYYKNKKLFLDNDLKIVKETNI